MLNSIGPKKKISDLVAIPILILAVWGYVLNMIAIANTVEPTVSGMFILRLIGIFFLPLGIILGFF